MEYPNVMTSSMEELVTFYNANSGLEPIKKFKNKAVGQEAVNLLIAKLEGTVTEEMEEEVNEVLEETQSSSMSLLSQLTAAGSVPSSKDSDKNVGVWANVKKLFDQGLTNKETLNKIHEIYGNSGTSYACIAWYRNKYKKMVPEVNPLDARKEAIDLFMVKWNLPPEALEEVKAWF